MVGNTLGLIGKVTLMIPSAYFFVHLLGPRRRRHVVFKCADTLSLVGEARCPSSGMSTTSSARWSIAAWPQICLQHCFVSRHSSAFYAASNRVLLRTVAQTAVMASTSTAVDTIPWSSQIELAQSNLM